MDDYNLNCFSFIAGVANLLWVICQNIVFKFLKTIHVIFQLNCSFKQFFFLG